MIEKNIKVNEVAKSFGVSSKDMLNEINEKYPSETRKTTSVLEKAQIDYVVKKHTDSSENHTIDEYFNLKPEDFVEKKKETKPREPKAKPAPKEAKPKTQKTDATVAKENTVKKEEKDVKTSNDTPRSNNNSNNNFSRSQNGNNSYQKRDQNRQNNYNNRDNNNRDNRDNRDNRQERKPYDQNRQNNYNNNRQNNYNNRNNDGYNRNNNGEGYNRGNNEGYNKNRSNNGYNRNNNEGYNRNNNGDGYSRNNYNNRTNNNNSNSAPVQEKKPLVAPKFDGPIEIKMQQPKKKEKAEAKYTEKKTASETVIVDMRSSEVNLDKYNERYETIAPTMRDNGVKKQKLNQRSAKRGKPIKSRKEREDDKLRRLEMERERRQRLEVKLPEEISVGDLAALLKVQASEIVKRLMTLGVMASVSDIIDFDTASLVAMEIGAKVEKEVKVTIEERLFEQEVEEDNTDPRAPIVVVMGHVDHGKTSLLDAIRNGHVADGEAGGITQHIGAYQVEINGNPITFLDTPGHAAFTSMRARGAQVTDIAILVVAADDGIKPQTVEAINHAKAAGVTIIVAINKMDKPTADPDKVKQQLTEYELVPEEWGGDIICVPVSAKKNEGIDNLLEMVLLVADMKELKANPNRMAKGTVIEAKLDKGRGPIATILIQNGTLHTGDTVIAGTSVGKVRVMTDDRGRKIDVAGPSTPVEITGLADVPNAGDIFNAVEDERLAKELVEKRRMEEKEEAFASFQKVTLDNLFDQISIGEMKELPIIIKGDVQGSVEAVKQSLEKLSNEEVRVKVIHGAVGAVSESDVMLAEASGAIIVGFNVRPDPIAKENAEHNGVDIRLYRIIYDAIEEIESAMKGMLAPKFKDVDLGRAEVRETYKITNVGTVAGCYVLDGKILRSANIRVVRDGIIIADDKMQSLKRFKDDVKEVAESYECGITLAKFTDIKVGDIFEAYEVQEIKE